MTTERSVPRSLTDPLTDPVTDPAADPAAYPVARPPAAGQTPGPGPALSAEVADALARRAPVVALESTIISHGLPRPRNLQVARELEGIVRKAGAVPATVAVLDGVPRVGLGKEEVERIAEDPGLRKLGFRDLAPALATGASGATTVSGTAFLAARAGIRVFGTGGLGGVHRGWVTVQDESADLGLLARTRITVVCAGVKSILDVPATLQRLETLGVGVLGYGTDRFPGFYLTDSGEPVDWTVGDPGQVAAVMAAQDELGGPGSALIVANPVPRELQLDPGLHDRVLAAALAAAGREGVTGQAITPFLLAYLTEHTQGASLEANLAAVRGNVALAAAIAVRWSERSQRSRRPPV
ncbi:pseudouridine-5'-phosphate glycosidase [Streptomyces sp. DvalAA-14]|uniref:pseudouridine-5'-phosphate glycosidase n=1 Tax=unclassified Streptomyces TaxID=2593676 RepID=UPI00081B93C7|nr:MULTISPECIES: pseudouridine-5'-phosphate glycosidase [unclassified Streptomyces]MYS22379.1 pseudouridine-5'-phosphate glycosidase [Streptomyces sp. SID4948]SCE14984.1 pseudouridine-5'-phosphate glycosidase [Streptomyces sp. DvalAA-14]